MDSVVKKTIVDIKLGRPICDIGSSLKKTTFDRLKSKVVMKVGKWMIRALKTIQESDM